ncbi:MAG TPA: carbon storage regulator [Gemmataceae bacterium]|nr:carbon storage regulator [Gemmataceae bacterium]
MLVLTRRPGESIYIGDEIRLTVVSARGDRIRLGIEAPPSVCIEREEVHERRLAFEASIASPEPTALVTSQLEPA